MRCAEEGCYRVFHFPCGRRHGCVTEFIEEFKSYCHLHVKDTNRIKHKGTFCLVCFQYIEEYSPVTSIFSTCCYENCLKNGITEEEEMANQTFVCSPCVQRYAVKAGYDAMCITCPMKNMKNVEWQNQMRKKGIFIPMKMAEWENEEHFKKQVKRTCSHPKCPDPKITANVWTCRVCGCHPLHLKCARVKTVDEYHCVKCIDQSFIQRVPFL